MSEHDIFLDELLNEMKDPEFARVYLKTLEELRQLDEEGSE